VNSPPPKPEVILTNFFAEPTVLLVPITSRAKGIYIISRDFLLEEIGSDRAHCECMRRFASFVNCFLQN
jgi:hypothetical protein